MSGAARPAPLGPGGYAMAMGPAARRGPTGELRRAVTPPVPLTTTRAPRSIPAVARLSRRECRTGECSRGLPGRFRQLKP